MLWQFNVSLTDYVMYIYLYSSKNDSDKTNKKELDAGM